MRRHRGESVRRVSEVAGASWYGSVMRRDGAKPGSIQAHFVSDSDDHWALRRRPAWRLHVLQTPHGIWDARREAEPFLDHWPVGSCRYKNPTPGSRGAEVRGSQRFGSE